MSKLHDGQNAIMGSATQPTDQQRSTLSTHGKFHDSSMPSDEILLTSQPEVQTGANSNRIDVIPVGRRWQCLLALRKLLPPEHPRHLEKQQNQLMAANARQAQGCSLESQQLRS